MMTARYEGKMSAKNLCMMFRSPELMALFLSYQHFAG